ncbi:MAG: integrase [Flavobacteriaceae bacterium]|nr:MAG: integrase [Flavobacteriaceae bacterium]
MNKRIKEFNELMSKAGNYLESELSYSLSTIARYRWAWKEIKNYMVINEIERYDQKVGTLILQEKLGGRNIPKLSESERFIYHGTRMLIEFQNTGIITAPARSQRKEDPIVFDGAVGEIITRFLNHKRLEERLTVSTLYGYRRNLFPFLQYCDKNSIPSIKDIDQAFILGYLGQLDCRKKTVVQVTILALRSFMKYAYQQRLLAIDYSNKIPRYRSVDQPKLPSTYSKGEIEKLIYSIDRSSPIGKRNYAIILLAARLGLRASDISRLKFTELHWDTSTIEIKQVKTGKELELPILPDIGNALIDYLKYGRPESESPFVFLIAKAPYAQFHTSQVVTHVVQRAYRKAGIDVKGRRFGAHSLRHSLGFRMLEESTALPVISEVFGHNSTESTRYYLRIDLKSMRQCMLDVPPVPTNFYEQKGGVFYE